jgi:hypothetical protein
MFLLHTLKTKTRKKKKVQYRKGAKDVLFLESKMFFSGKKCSFFRNKSSFVLEKVKFLTHF